MSGLLIAVGIGILGLFLGILQFFGFLKSLEDSLAASSRIGETLQERQRREKRHRWYVLIALVMTMAVVGGVVAWVVF